MPSRDIPAQESRRVATVRMNGPPIGRATDALQQYHALVVKDVVRTRRQHGRGPFTDATWFAPLPNIGAAGVNMRVSQFISVSSSSPTSTDTLEHVRHPHEQASHPPLAGDRQLQP